MNRPNDLQARLLKRKNRITHDVFTLWFKEEGRETVAHYERGIRTLARVNADYLGAPVLDTLLRQAQEGDGSAIDALRKLSEAAAQHPGVLNTLLQLAQQGQWWAISALGKLGGGAHPGVLDALLRQAQVGNSEAISALG